MATLETSRISALALVPASVTWLEAGPPENSDISQTVVKGFSSEGQMLRGVTPRSISLHGIISPQGRVCSVCICF